MISSPSTATSTPPVVIDACVLVNYIVTDLLLSLFYVSTPPFLLFWSSQILEETYRAHTQNLHWDPRIARSFQMTILKRFPTSLVSDYEKWIPHCTNHEKDRHVLACAIEAKASMILTYNLRDFAPKDLAPWHIRAIHPQEFLIELHNRDSEQITDALEQIASRRSRNLGHPVTVQDELRALAPFVPEFSKTLLAQVV